MKFFFLLISVLFYTGCNFSKDNLQSANTLSNTVQSGSKPSNSLSAINSVENNQSSVKPEKFNDEKTLKAKLSGIWKRVDGEVANGCADQIKIFFTPESDSFCVEGSQIYLKICYVLDLENRQVNLYFIETADLGRGGAGLSWENYNRKRPIATIDISDLQNNKIYLKWNGFYEKKAKRIDDYGKGYEGVYQKAPDNVFLENK